MAVYEPALPVTRPVISDVDYGRFVAALDADRVAEAALIGLDAVVEPNEEERALIESIAELTGPVLPANVKELPELNRPVDLPALASIRIRLALLQGSQSGDHFKRADRLVQEHVPHSRVIEIEGAGHLAPLTHPKRRGRRDGQFLAIPVAQETEVCQPLDAHRTDAMKERGLRSP
jgi:pimeloyl-ACP methyl ester carboxylesterase